MLWLEAGVDGVSFTDAFISNGVTFDTFVPQPFWILMIAAGQGTLRPQFLVKLHICAWSSSKRMK